MPEYRQNEASLWVSLNREAVKGTPLLTGANYLRATNNNPIVLIPEMEKTNDAERPGNDSEFPTAVCNQYWLPAAASFTDQAGFNLFGRLAMRAFGGVPLAPVNVVGVAWRHEASLLPKATGIQLPTSTIISELGGASYLFPHAVVDRMRMSQDGVAPVQLQFDMLNSGKHKGPHGIGTAQVETATAAGTASGNGNVNVVITAASMPGSPYTKVVAINSGDSPTVWAGTVRTALAADPIVNAFFAVSGAGASIILTARYTAANDPTMNISLDNGTPSPGITPALTSADTTPGAVTLPTQPAFACLKPKSFLEYNDGTLQDLTVNCRVRSWSVELANNHAPTDDRCIGDPTQNANDYTVSGGLSDAAYVAKLTRGSRTIQAQITILLDATLIQFLRMAENTAITGLTFGARGAVLDAGGPTYESLKVIIPNSRIVSVQEVDSNGKAALTLTFQPLYDAATVAAKVQVVNNISSNFD